MGTETIPETEEAVSAEAPSPLELQIIRQIEYYFGNYNLSRDKFLKEQVTVDNGWVPLETMVKFNRLKKLTEDYNVIIEALKKSPKQMMEISEDCTKIRRRDAQPIEEDFDKRQDELNKRTLYVKGFKKNNTLDELLDFFNQYKAEHVFMRRYMQQNNKPFKGSVLVIFETVEDAEKFLEKKGIKYNGTELLKEWKVDYLKRKTEQYENMKAEKEKKMLKRTGLIKGENENEEKTKEIEIIPGCLLKLSNLDSNTTREQIKEAFEPHGTVVYVDYSKGNPSAVLRFETGIASSVFEKLTEEDGERKVEIGSSKAVISLIEGDEEKDYWKNIAVSRAQSRLRFKGNRNFGNRGRFKKYGKRPRGKDDDDNGDKDGAESPKKKSKVDTSGDKEAASMEVSSDTSEKKKETSEAES